MLTRKGCRENYFPTIAPPKTALSQQENAHEAFSLVGSMPFIRFKKKSQTAYKPGSVLPNDARSTSSACHLSAPVVANRLYRSTLQRAALRRLERATLNGVGIHELSTSDVHSTHVTTRLVGSYPTFSPLPLSLQKGSVAVVFFCTNSPSRTTSR